MNTTSRITTLDDHRNLLKRVFQTAKSRVVVVSPFIAESAISQDNIPKLVHTAYRRGVDIDIFTDNALNRTSDGSLKLSAKGGMIKLMQAGANMNIVNGIHSKTLIRDNDLIAEGSFNWFSAVRKKGSELQREERTIVVEGEEAKGMIEEERRLKSLAKDVHIKHRLEIDTGEGKSMSINFINKNTLKVIAVVNVLLFIALGTRGVLAFFFLYGAISMLSFIASKFYKTKSEPNDKILEDSDLLIDTSPTLFSLSSENWIRPNGYWDRLKD